jgi:hypothetical protein
VDCDTKMVSILCDSAITAMGIKAIMNRFYPGYNARIVSKQFFETLNNKKQI